MIFLRLNIIIIFFLFAFNINAQFAPPAEQAGSTAIFADSSVFVEWANNAMIERGYVNISEPSLGLADYGVVSNTFGKADNLVLSLGDGGLAIFQFNNPIINGDGFDFAIFENSFLDDYLELCYVEVSTDGESYFRFDATSLTQTNIQVEGFGLIDASQINNLGGKYKVLFGTPFDLEELSGINGLNINDIRYIRIIDVVGCINNDYATYDSNGNIVNDPWPTPFPSSGFDIDAVGVIHNTISIKETEKQYDICIYPNPAIDIITINSSERIDYVKIISPDGKLIYSKAYSVNINLEHIIITTNRFSTGIYFITISTLNQVITKQIIIN